MTGTGQPIGQLLVAIENGTQTLAERAWDRHLDAVQIATLRDLNIDRRGWTLRFGYQLFLVVIMHGVPDSDHTLNVRLEALVPRLSEFAATYVRRLHGETRTEGADRLTQDATMMALIDARFSEADNGDPREAPTVNSLRLPLNGSLKQERETPFDGFIRTLTPKGDRVTIGPYVLAGGLELMALAAIVVISWVPLTLASTWRLAVFGEWSLWNLVKASIGWFTVLLVALELGRTAG